MTLIPKFNAYSAFANCLTFQPEQNLEEIKQEWNDYADATNNDQNWGNNPAINAKSALDSGSFYADGFSNILILGYSNKEIFENFFQIEKLVYSWNINAEWSGQNRDHINGWNGNHSYSNSGSVERKFSAIISSQSVFPTPTERICINADPFYTTSPVQDRSSMFATGFTFQGLGTIFGNTNFGSRGFGLNLGFNINFNLGYPNFDFSTNFYCGNFAFQTQRDGGLVWNPHFSLIPLIITDGDITYSGSIYASGDLGSDAQINSIDGNIAIQIVRYQFEQ